jgi:hypothetical protein
VTRPVAVRRRPSPVDYAAVSDIRGRAAVQLLSKPLQWLAAHQRMAFRRMAFGCADNRIDGDCEP